VRRNVFVGQWWAAIGDYLGTGNAYYENDYSGIGAGAVPVSPGLASQRPPVASIGAHHR